MKRAIIIGASSGIGRELAKILARDNYVLGLAARREALLYALQRELPTETYVKRLDIVDQDEAMQQLGGLISEMQGVDLVIVASGTGYLNEELDWPKERDTIAVNVSGVTAMINVAFKHFMVQQCGQLAVISSIAALRGGSDAPAYNASKAYLANYLEGIRGLIKHAKLNIVVTDIRPGFVATAMAQGEGLFWVQPVDKAARQIYQHIKRKKSVAYVTKRWALLACLYRHAPGWLIYK